MEKEKENPKSFFTVDEVNALVPRLEEHFQNFWMFRENAQCLLKELRQEMKDEGGEDSEVSKEVADQQIRKSQAHFLLEQAKKELNTIQDLGAQVKDLEVGLADFPHMLESEEEEVFLCWKYGEKKVRFWHKVTEGFVNRKPFARKVHH